MQRMLSYDYNARFSLAVAMLQVLVEGTDAGLPRYEENVATSTNVLVVCWVLFDILAHAHHVKLFFWCSVNFSRIAT
jgi:hypothetical protein